MDQFWVDMILEGKARFSDIKSEARKAKVKKILDQYLEEGKISQDLYDDIFDTDSI